MPDPYHYIDEATGEYRLYTYPEEEYVYTTTDLASAIKRATLKLEDKDITEESGFSPMVLMYKQAELFWDTYYYPLPASQRIVFREQPDDINALTEAYLFLWGKLTVLRNPRSLSAVELLMGQYGIPDKAVPAMVKIREQQALEEQPPQEKPPTTPEGWKPKTRWVPR